MSLSLSSDTMMSEPVPSSQVLSERLELRVQELLALPPLELLALGMELLHGAAGAAQGLAGGGEGRGPAAAADAPVGVAAAAAADRVVAAPLRELAADLAQDME